MLAKHILHVPPLLFLTVQANKSPSIKPAVQATPALELKAIYSRSLKSAQTLSPGFSVDYYSDDSGSGKTYHDLLLRPDIQAVIIALPIPSQPEHIEAALAAGKHVLSEKPIAKDLKTARKLIEYYRKGDKVTGGATWGVAENFRFLEPYEVARGEIEKLGRINGFGVVSLNYVAGGKYYGMFLSRLLTGFGCEKLEFDEDDRNCVEKDTRISRRLPTRWRGAHISSNPPPPGSGSSTDISFGLYITPAETSSPTRHHQLHLET